MIDPQKAIQKLRRPPAVQNWVKNLRLRTDDTAHSLYNTAVNGPRHSLKQVTDIVRLVVVDGIDDETALKCVRATAERLLPRYRYEIRFYEFECSRENGSWQSENSFLERCRQTRSWLSS